MYSMRIWDLYSKTVCIGDLYMYMWVCRNLCTSTVYIYMGSVEQNCMYRGSVYVCVGVYSGLV